MKISIEFGHVYFDSAPYQTNMLHGEKLPKYSRELNKDELASKSVGLATKDFFSGQGHAVTTHLLIDDVVMHERQRRSHSDGWRYNLFRQRVKQAAVKMFGTDKVDSEGELVVVGREIIERIEGSYSALAGQINGPRISIPSLSGKKIRVKIKGFKGVDDVQYPSCEVLDLAYQIERAAQTDVFITVLPIEYKDQQERVHALSHFLGDELLAKIGNATLFTDDEGKVIEIARWNEPTSEIMLLFDKLEKEFVKPPRTIE